MKAVHITLLPVTYVAAGHLGIKSHTATMCSHMYGVCAKVYFTTVAWCTKCFHIILLKHLQSLILHTFPSSMADTF